MKKTKPSDFTNFPFNSVEQNSERETIARNIMVILARTGNTWRDLTLDEYISERNRDAHKYNRIEEDLFLSMRWWCKNAEEASKFSPAWR